MLEFDHVLVGGGLQNGLIALALRARQPRARIAMIERAPKLGGNHTWCFHESDVPPRTRDWIEPLIVHRWPGHRVAFPHMQRRMDGEYCCIRSDRFHEVIADAIRSAPGSALLTETDAVALDAACVRLAGGGEVTGSLVVDARGPEAPRPSRGEGYQKFLGLELSLARPHGLDLPILMDAMVDQAAGYRFVYVLPLTPRTVLVEDTFIHRSAVLERDSLRAAIRDYAARRGWEVEAVLREEAGVLPMPWADRRAGRAAGPLVAGYRGGWFHPGTGYSIPVAARLAEIIAALLNRLQFQWYPPRARSAIYERFYRLPDSTIRNFYALRMNWYDRLRLVGGAPPPGLSLRHRLRPEPE
jgi:lycopene beta-cyclase